MAVLRIHLTQAELEQAIRQWIENHDLVGEIVEPENYSLQGDFHCLGDDMIVEITIPQEATLQR